MSLEPESLEFLKTLYFIVLGVELLVSSAVIIQYMSWLPCVFSCRLCFLHWAILLACQHFHRWSGRRNKTSQLLKNCYMKDKTGTVLITFWSIKFFLLYRSNISLRKVQSKSLLTFSLYFHFSNATSVLVYFFRYFYAHMNSICIHTYCSLLVFFT